MVKMAHAVALWCYRGIEHLKNGPGNIATSGHEGFGLLLGNCPTVVLVPSERESRASSRALTILKDVI